ncbi:SHOCT domain-containing protein [Kocuria aegyptia]|uniref:SHOCT domain-containing protein n=1 Tax=Kocuria aegyptia TaxID=330943 RepID=A0ABP4WI96_9MICC
MMWGDGMGWGMGWMWVFWILLVLGTVVLVFVLIKVLTGSSGTHGGTSPGGYGQRPGPARAREILEERYARGEISTEEFRERLRTLEEGGR